jgi:hypothetical protein
VTVFSVTLSVRDRNYVYINVHVLLFYSEIDGGGVRKMQTFKTRLVTIMTKFAATMILLVFFSRTCSDDMYSTIHTHAFQTRDY